MKNIKYLISCTAVLLFSQSLFGQPGMVSSSPYERPKEQRDLRNAQDRVDRLYGDKDQNGMINQPRSPEPFKRNRKKNTERIAEIKAVALADIEEINRKMTAPQVYLNKYPEYVKGKNAGIFRIFPDKNCGTGKVVDVKELERCGNLPQVLGFGSKVSFSLSSVPDYLVTAIGYLFAHPDIEYKDNTFYAGNSTTETLITEIGDADLNSIDSKTPEFQFLKKWRKSDNQKEFLSHRKLIENGINNKGRKYSSDSPVKLNSAYLLRSIAFYDGYSDFLPKSDLLVAFKIVGQENDGSLIIIWKQLRKKDAPSIKR